MKVSVNWLKEYVQINPPMERVAERLTMAGLEVKKIEPVPASRDTIFEIEITSNRPDWLSHIGVAREIAAVENLSLKIPAIDKSSGRPMPPDWRVNLKDAEGCPYYTGVYIEGIDPSAQTPDFMRDRLLACGIRPISLIVDITNYVLLETGQPLHAFDADTLHGKEIQVRRAKAGETFSAINGMEYKLTASDLVIADTENVVALAGVMGGKDSEMSGRTRNIFLESAFFHPRWVRQTARRTGLGSESSYRFERRVDPEGVDYGRDRAVSLIMQLAKPRFVSGILKAGEKPLALKELVHLSLNEIEKKLGVGIKPNQVSSILTRLNFDVKQDSAENWKVKVPSFRPDVTSSVDLVEEVARIHGYEHIPETLPMRAPTGFQPDPTFMLEDKARNFFSGIGFYETVTFSVISSVGIDAAELKRAVSVKNPLNKDLVWMRPFLWPSLLPVIQRNKDLGARRVALYEIANIYNQAGAKNPAEEPVVGMMLFGSHKEKSWLDPERPATYYDIKGIAQEFLDQSGASEFSFEPASESYFVPGICEKITAGNSVIGLLGEIRPEIARIWDLETSVYYAQISLNALKNITGGRKTFHEMPKFPSIERDLSVTVSESVKAGEIESRIRKMGKGLIVRVELFDLFRGGRIPKGNKNLGFRITYQSLERTLVSDDIQKLHSEIGATIATQFQASFQ